eukprot:scaffold668_cov385-Prasinococcus_capsulatus_cf.AAC.21
MQASYCGHTYGCPRSRLCNRRAPHRNVQRFRRHPHPHSEGRQPCPPRAASSLNAARLAHRATEGLAPRDLNGCTARSTWNIVIIIMIIMEHHHDHHGTSS